MTVEYALTPELRIKLKDPFGTLIRGTFDETMGKMKQLIKEEKPPKLISVGDVVSVNLHMHNITPTIDNNR